MAIPDPPSPPPDLIQNSDGNYFVYAYVFDHTRFPAYAEHIPTGGVKWRPELMVCRAAVRLGLGHLNQCPHAMPVPLAVIRDFLAPGQPMPRSLPTAPFFILYADYKGVDPELGIKEPKLRNLVSEADLEKLRKFEAAFGVDCTPPQWYATRRRRR